MGKVVYDKLADLEYNELVTLRVIETDEMATSLLRENMHQPFLLLYKLSKEGMFTETDKERIRKIFDYGICGDKKLIDRYNRILSGESIEPETEQEVIVESIVEPVVETILETKPSIAKVTKPKLEKELPRRYGKEKIEKDIEAQGGKATPVQKAMLKVNNLKNIVVNLAERGKKDMLTGSQILSDVDCREIVSVVTIAERKLEEILKRKGNVVNNLDKSN